MITDSNVILGEWKNHKNWIGLRNVDLNELDEKWDNQYKLLEAIVDSIYNSLYDEIKLE